MEKKQYKAFISYSSKDEEFGAWLHKKLENYKIPSGLIKDHPHLPKKLYPIFRDKYELTTGDDLEVEIPRALQNSEALIIICSQNAKESDWVNKEIKDFKKLYPHRKLLPVMKDGEKVSERTFPEALQYKYDNQGNITNKKIDILASNPDTEADGKELAIQKLIAGILSVPYGEFYKRDEEQKQKDRNRSIKIWSSVAISLALFLGGALYQWDRAEKELIKSSHNLGLRYLEKSEKNLGYMASLSQSYAKLALSKLKPDSPERAVALGNVMQRTYQQVFSKYETNYRHSIGRVAHSPDSSKLAFSVKGTIKIFDTLTGGLIKNINNKGYVSLITFSPDGKQIAVVSDDIIIQIWEINSNKQVLSFKGHNEYILDIKYSPDGKQLATSSADTYIKIWNANNGNLINTLKGHQGKVYAISYIDDRTLTSFSEDKTTKIWGTTAGNESILSHQLDIAKSMNEPTGSELLGFERKDVDAVAYSFDGLILATSSDDGIIQLWDSYTGRLVSKFNNKGSIGDLAFSPNGKLLAISKHGSHSGSTIKIIELWNIEKQKLLNTFWVDKTGTVRTDLTFSSDGKLLFSTNLNFLAASDTLSILAWDISKPGANFVAHEGLTPRIGTMDYSPNGKQIAFSFHEKVPNRKILMEGRDIAEDSVLVEIDSLTAKPKLVGRHEDTIRALKYESNGKELVSASRDGYIKIWDIGKKTLIDTIKPLKINNATKRKGTNIIRDIVFVPSLNQLVSTSAKTIKLWDFESRKLLDSEEVSDDVGSLDYCLISKRLISIDYDNNINIWDTSNNKLTLIRTIEKTHNRSANIIKCNPVGKQIASASFDGTVKFWDVSNGNLINTLEGHKHHISDISYSIDGKQLVSVSFDGRIHLWDTSTGNRLFSIDELDAIMLNVSFSPDGRQFVSSDTDGHIKFWSLDNINNYLSRNNSNWEEDVGLDIKKFGLELDGLDLEIRRPEASEVIKNTLGVPHWPEHHINHWLIKLKEDPNNPEYMYQVALIYERDNNYYHPKLKSYDDNLLALIWYKKAADKGYVKAKERLNHINGQNK